MKNKYIQSEYFRQQQLQRVKNKSKEQRNIWFEDKLQEELKLLKNKREYQRNMRLKDMPQREQGNMRLKDKRQ